MNRSRISTQAFGAVCRPLWFRPAGFRKVPRSNAVRFAGVAVCLFVTISGLVFTPISVFADLPFPVFPSHLDAPTLSRLLAHCDEHHNDVVLFMGYYAVNGSQDLPGDEGLQMLRDQLSRETTGSLRWYCLNTLLGFTACRYYSAQDGMNAFGAAIPTAVAQEKKAPLSPAVAEQVAHLVQMYSWVIGAPWSRSVDRKWADALLGQAFTAWAALPDGDYTEPGYPSPKWKYMVEWADAAAAVGGEKTRAAAEAALKASPDPFVLEGVAEVLAAKDPVRAAALSGQAAELAGQGNPDRFGDLAARANQFRVQDLVETKSWDEAIAAQTAVAKTAPNGYAYLGYLLIAGDRPDQFPTVIQALCAPDADENQVLEFGAGNFRDVLTSRHPEAAVGACATVLREYLLNQRTRTPKNELEARIALANLLSSHPAKALRDGADLGFLRVDRSSFPAGDKDVDGYWTEYQAGLKRLDDALTGDRKPVADPGTAVPTAASPNAPSVAGTNGTPLERIAKP